jgi:hypothetical protein
MLLIKQDAKIPHFLRFVSQLSLFWMLESTDMSKSYKNQEVTLILFLCVL